MPEKLWKRAERRLCEMLGGKRRGATGRDDPDCVHEWLAVEIKCRKKMPQYIKDWLHQAYTNAEDDKLTVVVWHEAGCIYANAVMMMFLGDFLDWFGDGDALQAEQVAAALDGHERLPFTDVIGELGSPLCREEEE